MVMVMAKMKVRAGILQKTFSFQFPIPYFETYVDHRSRFRPIQEDSSGQVDVFIVASLFLSLRKGEKS